MREILSPRRVGLAVLALCLAAAGLAGCAKKSTVDPSFLVPEGTPAGSKARLIVWPDTPNGASVYNDNGPQGPSPEDTPDTTLSFYATGPGAFEGAIYDATPASGYQVFRRESNGGLRQLKDFVLHPTRRWLDSEWEYYSFADGSPSGFTPASYIGRGLVSGTATSSSPLTNLAEAAAPVSGDLVLAGDPTNIRDPFRFPTDSLFTVQWSAVPGAVGYFLQIYQFRNDLRSSDEIIQSGLAAPAYVGKSRDTFVGFVSGSITSYKLGSSGAQVLTSRPPLFGQQYLVRVAAVNATGQLIAYSSGDSGFVQGATTYEIFPLGAVVVSPSHPQRIAQARMKGGGEEPPRLIETSIPNFFFKPRRH